MRLLRLGSRRSESQPPLPAFCDVGGCGNTATHSRYVDAPVWVAGPDLVVDLCDDCDQSPMVGRWIERLYKGARRRVYVRTRQGPNLMGRLLVDGPYVAIVVPWADQEQAEEWADELRDGGRIERRTDG